MDIITRTIGDVTLATLRGDLDGKTAPTAHEELVPLCNQGGKLVLEMGEVTYMSSAGLRLMLLLYRQMRAAQGELVLVGLSDDLKDTMAATGFLSYFTTAETLEAGLAAANRG
jgi:anti-sigma B factor antagonist